MAGREQHYISYVLRMWLPVGGATWHASLLDPQTGERVGFASLDDLWAYLMQHARRLGDQASEPSERSG